MNAVELIDQQILAQPKRLALWFPDHGSLSFEELDALAQRIAGQLLRKGCRRGDNILLGLELAPHLYATILAMARLGLTALLVEPWMPLDRINTTIEATRPRAFLAGWKGRLWGLRARAIRQIPVWLLEKDLATGERHKGPAEVMDGPEPLIITFTSGTTGQPKGVVRSHAYLLEQCKGIHRAFDYHQEQGPDLCIFANLALANLAAGRPSIIIPSRWSAEDLTTLNSLPREMQPETMIVGPTFLERVLRSTQLAHLRSYFVGGAQTDCHLLEQAGARWPAARGHLVYGSTEVEPVAHTDARESVRRSRDRGYFQALFLGPLDTQLQSQVKNQQFWITGPHVCGFYLANEKANQEYKYQDEAGHIWHRMGDRIGESADGLWYQGRDQSPLDDFLLEQRLYLALGHSRAMIERDMDGAALIYCENARQNLATIRTVVPDVKHIFQVKMRRDRRHRARIDRQATKKGYPWRVG
jgi:acyl-coenzyme A synthetase/AMP-(fatty) acid ligase